MVFLACWSWEWAQRHALHWGAMDVQEAFGYAETVWTDTCKSEVQLKVHVV